MRAMILAAGRGQRLRPLTDHTPKPLLEIDGETLIERHVQRLVAADIQNIVINLSWLGHLIRDQLGDGSRYRACIHYSDEGNSALESAGGIRHALKYLGEEPFLLVNADIWTDYDFHQLVELAHTQKLTQSLAHLVLAPNPGFHPQGDFALNANCIEMHGEPRYTYTGISLLHPQLFESLSDGVPIPMRDVLMPAIKQGQVSGELYHGQWFNVNSMDELTKLREKIETKALGWTQRQ